MILNSQTVDGSHYTRFFNSYLIRTQNLNFSYSDNEKLELIKCSEDFNYFTNRYFNVNDNYDILNGGNLFIAQSSKGNDINYTKISIYLTWASLFKEDIKIAIIDINSQLAKKIQNGVVHKISKLPFYMQCGLKYRHQCSLKFDNGAEIIALSTSPYTLRGLRLDILYVCNVNLINQFTIDVFLQDLAVYQNNDNFKLIVTSNHSNDKNDILFKNKHEELFNFINH